MEKTVANLCTWLHVHIQNASEIFNHNIVVKINSRYKQKKLTMIYIVSLKATDYANRKTTQSSPPINIDTTPPIKTDKPVTIPGRHITSDTEIEAW